MSTYTIPTKNDVYHYSQQVELDGELYTLTFTLNYRVDCWHMAIGEEQEILEGVRLVGGIDILKQFHHLDVPPGEMWCIDLDNSGREPTKELFGDRVVLRYIEDE